MILILDFQLPHHLVLKMAFAYVPLQSAFDDQG